jgi:hypothetical protein
MKRILNTIILLALALAGQAQSSDRQEPGKSAQDPCVVDEVKISSWRLSPVTGAVIPAQLDTAFLNFYRTDCEDSFAPSYNYLGNFGSPGESRTYFERNSTPDFLFGKTTERFFTSPDKKRFYNTQIPFTQLSYLTGGSKANAEERLIVNFGGNVNRRVGLGASCDYIYARGFYNYAGVKDLNWTAYSYYLGERYQIQGYVGGTSYTQQENGGISDVDYILKPENVNSNLSDPKNIPTHLENAWSRLKQHEVFISQRYSLGFDRTYMVSEDDSTEYKQFVPVTSFVHTFHYRTNKHNFEIASGGIVDKTFFENTYLDASTTNDSTSYQSISNTLALTLNEGFNRYAKFGLAAFATMENRKYTNLQDSTNLAYIPRAFKTNVLWVGGELSKTQGSILTYNASARFALSGYNLGDLEVQGRLQTRIPLFGDSVVVAADGYFRNTEPAYHLTRYVSNHFMWQNSFDKERRVRIRGHLHIPQSRTTLSAGVENVSNLLYFDDASLPAQHGGNIQVFQAMLQQNFKLGVLNWDNTVVYQKSSNEAVLPLPDLSVYSQLYLKFRIARVLYTQLGVDGYYFTSYYAPTYQPATMMFHTQSESKVGNYPLLNAYANMKLKQTRFFVMFYHANKGLLGSNDYFLSPYYPMNPRVFKIGVSIEFSK